MNILYFHPHFTYPGGAGKFVLETGERLAEMGHNVTVLSQSGDPEILKNYPNIKFKFIGGPLPNRISHWILFPLLMKRIFKLTKCMDIDVIFPQVFPANYWGFLFKRKYPEIQCLWYCHDLGSFIYQRDLINGLKNPIKTLTIIVNPFIKQIDKSLVKNVDFIITNSNFTRKFIQDTYGLKSEVIFPGVDITKFRPVNKKENILFTANRLSKFKKIHVLLNAMVLIKNTHLYIGGDGEEKENLEYLSKELGISKKVTFLGNLNDEQLNNYYSKAKIAVFPAENEAFGISQLEAMAAGTPVVAINSGGVVESVKDGVTGYLVNPTNTDSLVMKINYLITNPDLCSQMSKNARIHVEKNFTWDLTAKKLHQFIISSIKS